MHAHDQLARVVQLQLETLIDEMILGDQVELVEVVVLAELLEHDLLLSELALDVPQR